MRVIAGVARSCRLSAPKGSGTRPTADRLKENLFNVLQPYIPGACFLDIFSGSGAIGIEALSRGARKAVFVESTRQAAEVIRGNLQATRLSGQASVLPYTAVRAIRLFSQGGGAFDIIFMDPPYESGLLKETFTLLESAHILAPAGILAAELPAQADPPASAVFDIQKIKTYGSTQLAFYTHKATNL